MITLLCKAFIAILEVLLLDFYIKNIYPDIYRQKFIKYCPILYFIIILCLSFVNHIELIIFFHLTIIIILTFIFYLFHIPILEFIKKILYFYFIKSFVFLLTIFFLSWLFNTKFSLNYLNYTLPYTLVVHLIEKYLTFLVLIITLQKLNKQNIKVFKTISIFLLIYFSLTFIIKNPILFKLVSITRTYIFTVVISIIALICFDRMQTKYEKDKHLQESIIQNLEKEKEFNQQREQQQKEIRKINHNLNNILIILQSHLEKEEYEEAKDYIEQNLKTHVEAYQALTHTGIAAIDGALNAHIQSIKEKGIQYDEDISKILHLGSIVPGDLALIISLALDNAKEACENIEGEKHISLKLQSKQTHVILYIENSIPEGSHPTFHKTSKKDKIAHGFGVSSIKEMAERYHGEAKYEVEHDQVILRVVLQK